MCQKRPTKETYTRDLTRKYVKEICKKRSTDCLTFKCDSDLERRDMCPGRTYVKKDTYLFQKRYVYKETYTRDFKKKPVKVTCKKRCTIY